MAIVSRLHDGAAWPNSKQKGRSRKEVIRRPFSFIQPISHCVAISKRGDHFSLFLVWKDRDKNKNENSLDFMEK